MRFGFINKRTLDKILQTEFSSIMKGLHNLTRWDLAQQCKGDSTYKKQLI